MTEQNIRPKAIDQKRAEILTQMIEEKKLGQFSSELLIGQDGRMDIFFSPHNLYISPKTQVLIVGICPGKKQSEIALKAISEQEGILQAKKKARFAGQTKKNLLEMLDGLGIEQILHQTGAELLEDLDSGLDTIALIPFPVFINQKNYSGHSPAILSSALLVDYIENWFIPQIQKLPLLKVLIPLGKGVEEALFKLQERKQIPEKMEILAGFPHPSGLNTSRKTVFAANQDQMRRQLQRIFLIDDSFKRIPDCTGDSKKS